MADVNTNVLVDLNGLNKAYKQNKDRIDDLINGVTSSGYAEKIGEGSSAPSSLGSSDNPVYVSSGVITPMMGSSATSFSLGGSGIENAYIGGASSQANVQAKDFTASASVSAPTGSFGSAAITPKVSVIGESRSANLEYDSSLDALVFNFTNLS